jgi:hypothetical protein
LGALIGGVAGGGKGAGIGAAAGAAGGTAVAASKKGQQLQIPSESLLEFRLAQPASLPVPAEVQAQQKVLNSDCSSDSFCYSEKPSLVSTLAIAGQTMF